MSKEFCPFCEYSTLCISDAGTLSWFYAGTVIGNWQTSAPSSPLPTLSRNPSFSSMSSLVTSVCSQSSKLVSTFSRTTSAPAKIGMDKGEGNTGLDDLNDSFEEIRELRQLVRGRSYRSSLSPRSAPISSGQKSSGGATVAKSYDRGVLSSVVFQAVYFSVQLMPSFTPPSDPITF